MDLLDPEVSGGRPILVRSVSDSVPKRDPEEMPSTQTVDPFSINRRYVNMYI